MMIDYGSDPNLTAVGKPKMQYLDPMPISGIYAPYEQAGRWTGKGQDNFWNIAGGLPGISSFGSFILGAIDMFTSGPRQRRLMREQAELQYKYSQMAAEEEWRRQQEFWRMNNEYNLPSNVRRRLEQAGLLGASLFEGGGASIPSQMPSSGTPSGPSFNGDFTSTPGLRAANTMMDMLQRFADIKNTNANTEKTQSETMPRDLNQQVMESNKALVEARIVDTEYSARSTQLSNTLQQATMDTSIDSAKTSLRTAKEIYDQQVARTISIMNENARNPMVVKQLENNLRLQGTELAIGLTRIALMRSGIEVNTARLEEIASHILQMNASANFMGSTAALNEQTFQRNAPRTKHAKLDFWTNYVLNIVQTLAGAYSAVANSGESKGKGNSGVGGGMSEWATPIVNDPGVLDIMLGM